MAERQQRFHLCVDDIGNIYAHAGLSDVGLGDDILTHNGFFDFSERSCCGFCGAFLALGFSTAVVRGETLTLRFERCEPLCTRIRFEIVTHTLAVHFAFASSCCFPLFLLSTLRVERLHWCELRNGKCMRVVVKACRQLNFISELNTAGTTCEKVFEIIGLGKLLLPTECTTLLF